MPPGRAIWSGAISFGLVNIPVKLVPATSSKDVRFNQLDADTGSRIRYRRIAEATGEEVSPEQIVKGYEISKGRYVTVEPDELDALSPIATHTIEIQEFVPLADIDPVYFDKPYLLVPDRNGEKAYQLLLQSMQDMERAAVGRVIIRQKEHLAAIRPRDGVLSVETLRFSDEILDTGSLDIQAAPELEPSEREVAMARQLVEQLTADWEPDKYHDDYREQVLELIERKAAGEEIVTEPEVEPSTKVLDLMAALEASIERGKGDGPGDAASAGPATGEDAPDEAASG